MLDRSPFLIRSYEHALTDAFCDDLVANFEAIPNAPHHVMNESWRRCRIVRIVECQARFLTELRAGLIDVWNDYRSTADPLGVVGSNPQLEIPQVIRYLPAGAGYFHDHADAWNTESTTRQVSTVAYLNDVVEGGETVFPQHGVRLQPRKGTVAIFPSSFLFTHRAEAPISGVKYAILSWFHFHGPTTYASVPLLTS